MYSYQIAGMDDYPMLQTFYATYFPKDHPLCNQTFWRWMYTNEDYGQSIIAKDAAGVIIGHLGYVKGGDMNWLVNILINKSFSGMGIIDALFAEVRKTGPLAVAVANAAGSALLSKKKWIRHPNLERFIWIHPTFRKQPLNAEFFSPIQTDLQLSKPEGYFWQQPFLESILFEWGDTAIVGRKSGGLRVVNMSNPSEIIRWAIANDIKWMDFVCSSQDIITEDLHRLGWGTLVNFPWFLDPLEMNRPIELNLFSELPLPDGFRFLRTYADMARVGKITAT